METFLIEVVKGLFWAVFGIAAFIGLSCLIVGRDDYREYDPLLPPEKDPDYSESHMRRAAFYIAGNDAYPALPCPYARGSEEAAQWIAGWTDAARGGLVEGRDERNALRAAAHEAVVATRH